MYKINTKPNTSVSTDTLKNKLPQRPWSVNYALSILFMTALYGFVFKITKDTFDFITLINIMVYCAVLFGMFKGKILVRNIFFIISIPALLILAIGSVAMLQKPMLDTFTIIETVLFSIIVATSYVMLFMKSSQEWFCAMEGSNVKKESHTISWNFQITLIILSIVIGIVIMLLDISFIDIKELIQGNYPNEKFRIVAIIANLSISLFISSLIVLLPFSMAIGYWKKANPSILTRLITMGVILPSMPFTPGNTLEIMGSFFIVKVIMTAYIAYFSINLGTKVYAYIKKDTI
ncbi:hypothetical protein [Sulfurimonas sp.]|uniref:hypothetical protein n=1 Tax=Sulfurimonas sp. TaxID=2022749 RepID=UPI002B46EDBA|nr:hypothetical protein [Sulfurimonas sp.]